MTNKPIKPMRIQRSRRHKMKKYQFKAIMVKWHDALSNDGWFELDEAIKWAEEEREPVLDVGWLIKKTPNWVLISTSYSTRINMFDYLKRIPTKIIESIEFI